MYRRYVDIFILKVNHEESLCEILFQIKNTHVAISQKGGLFLAICSVINGTILNLNDLLYQWTIITDNFWQCSRHFFKIWLLCFSGGGGIFKAKIHPEISSVPNKRRESKIHYKI